MKCNILHFFLPYDIKFHSVNTLSKLETSIFSICCGLHGNAADIKRFTVLEIRVLLQTTTLQKMSHLSGHIACQLSV